MPALLSSGVLQSLWSCRLFCTFCVQGIIQHVAFYVWPPSLSIVFFRLIYVAAFSEGLIPFCDWAELFLWLSNIPLHTGVCMHLCRCAHIHLICLAEMTGEDVLVNCLLGPLYVIKSIEGSQNFLFV